MAGSVQEMPPGKQPTVSPELEARLRQDYVRTDERYNESSQLRDWIILFIIGAIDFLWMLIIFLTEKGIR